MNHKQVARQGRTTGAVVEPESAALNGEQQTSTSARNEGREEYTNQEMNVPDVSGHWKVVYTENLDALLAAAGAPWIVRKFLKNAFAKATMVIKQKGRSVYVEDKSNSSHKKQTFFKFVEGVESKRKDNYGFQITEKCKWDYESDKGLVWTLHTYGYYDNKYGPVVSRYYIDASDDTLLSEVIFKGVKMFRKWKRDFPKDKQASNGPGWKARNKLKNRRKEKGVKSHADEGGQALSEVEKPAETQNATATVKFLLYGKTGWIGCQVATLLVGLDVDFEFGRARLENMYDIQKDIERVKPTHVINASGCVPHDPGLPPRAKNILMRANLTGVLNLADACFEHQVHLTHFSDTGQQPVNEEGESFYLWTKKKAEELLAPFQSNTLILKLGLPLNADVKHPHGGFAQLHEKVARGEKITFNLVNVSVLPEVLPYAINMATNKSCGIFNLVNPEPTTQVRLLTLYQRFVIPDLSWTEEICSEDEKGEEMEGIAERFPSILSTERSLEKYIFEPNSPYEDAPVHPQLLCGLFTAPWSSCTHSYESLKGI